MISRWLENLFAKPQPATTLEDRHAVAALLYEVARADGQWLPQESEVFHARLAERWQLSAEQVAALAAEGQQLAENATDYHELLKVLRGWNPQQRRELVFDLWAIAHADGEIDSQEEYIIRKIADLLHVSHSDFIRGKLQQG